MTTYYKILMFFQLAQYFRYEFHRVILTLLISENVILGYFNKMMQYFVALHQLIKIKKRLTFTRKRYIIHKLFTC